MTVDAQPYNPAVVACLRIAYRRGLAVLEQQQRERWEAFVAWCDEWLGEPSPIRWPVDDGDEQD